MKSDSLDKMKTTSLESKHDLGRSRKGLIASLGPKYIERPKENARYAIGNVSKKELSKIIRKFEKILYESYERKRPKHDPTDGYFT